MSGRTWETGVRTRTIRCSFCGGEHRRKSKEARECRQRARKGIEPPPAIAEAPARNPSRSGDETTRYMNDPLKGDKQAHAIAKQLRAGWPPRKVAKTLGISIARVNAVRSRLNESHRG